MLRLFSRDLRLFLVSAILVSLAWDGIRAVLLNLYLLRLGYGQEFVGLVNGVGALAFALWCPPAGAMGTRWGSRKMLIAGVSLLTAGFWLLPLAEFLTGAWRTGWLLANSMLTYLGLYALQHRGQESAGIATYADKIYIEKGMGLVSDIFNKVNLGKLKGNMGIGHVRYSTAGASQTENSQPLLISYKGGTIAIAHNGHLVNYKDLRAELVQKVEFS